MKKITKKFLFILLIFSSIDAIITFFAINFLGYIEYNYMANLLHQINPFFILLFPILLWGTLLWIGESFLEKHETEFRAVILFFIIRIAIWGIFENILKIILPLL